MITAKNRIKAVFSLLLAGVMASQTAMSAFAESGIIDDFTDIEYIRLVEGETSEFGETDFYFEDEDGNLVEIDLSTDQYDDYGVLPSSYDLRDYGVVTSVKGQGSTGTCWAHSAIAAAESNLVYKGLATSDVDLSEAHLVWFTEAQYVSDANDPLYMDFNTTYKGAVEAYNPGGGNINKARSALSSGMGAALESNYPIVTDAPAIDESKRYDTAYFLENCWEYDVSDRAAIKSALMNNGALTISYYYDDVYENETANGGTAFYNNVYTKTNHAVTLVGWDDNYSASNFAATPAGNGAWLCKNSWDTWYGEDGYFWLSYYDTSIARINALGMVKGDKYSHIYQYAGSYDGYISTRNCTLSGANIFTAVNDDPITAVSFQTAQPNATCDIYIFTGVGSTPTSGTKVLAQSTQVTNAGLYTIALDNPVNVTKGTKFSVIVALTSSGELGLCLDDNSNSAGHGFYCTSDPLSANVTWKDTYTAFYNDVHVKALTSPAVKPAAPENVKATAGTGKVTLTWSAVSGATKYRVRRNDGTGWVTLKDLTATSYTDEAVTNGTKYSYVVYAYVGGAFGDASAIVTATPVNTVAQNVKATAGNAKVTLTWSAVSGATKYRVRRNDGTKWVTLKDITTTSYTDEAVTNGTKYSYVVYAYVNGAFGDASAIVTATPVNTVAQNVKATAGNAKVTLTWSAVSGATKYRVRRNDGTKWVNLEDVATTNYTDKAVINGTKYSYAIYAYVNGAFGDASAIVTATPVNTVAQNVKATAGNAKVTLTWSAVSGATKYRVRRNDGTKWVNLEDVATTSYTDKAVTNGTKYSYAIYAYVNGAWGDASAIVSATPANTAAQNVKAAATSGKITVTWSAVSGATKYRVRRHDGSAWSNYKDLADTSLVDAAVTAGTTYKYAVYAYVNGAWGEASAIVSATAK